MLQKQWSKYFFNFHNLNLILISNSILCIIAWLSTLTVPSQLQDGNLEAYPYELFIFASSIMLIFAVWFIVNLGNYIFEHIKNKKWVWYETDIQTLDTIFPTIIIGLVWFLTYEYAFETTAQYTLIHAPTTFISIEQASFIDLAFNIWEMNAPTIILILGIIQLIIISINAFATIKNK